MSGAPSEPCITGTIVRGHLEILEGLLGAEVLRAARLDLQGEARAVMESITAAGWVPIPVYEAFYEAVARRAGRSVADLHTEISRLSIERIFKTVWRVLLRFTSDEALVARTPLLFSRGYNQGKLTSTIRSPGIALLELHGWPAPPDIVLRGLRVAVETVLRVAGRRSVGITYERAADGATFQATWRTAASAPPLGKGTDKPPSRSG